MIVPKIKYIWNVWIKKFFIHTISHRPQQWTCSNCYTVTSLWQMAVPWVDVGLPVTDVGPMVSAIRCIPPALYTSYRKPGTSMWHTENILTTRTTILSWCQLRRQWWHRRMSCWQSKVLPVTTRLASWQFSVFRYWLQLGHLITQS